MIEEKIRLSRERVRESFEGGDERLYEKMGERISEEF